MQFTYTPDGSDEPQVWDFSPDKLMSPEAEAIERQTGFTFAEWQDKVLSGSVTAIHGLLWVMLKRENPTLKYDQVVFAMGEVGLDFTAEERAEILRELLKRDAIEGLEPPQRALLEQLQGEAAEAGDPPISLEDPADDEGGEDGPGDGSLALVPKDAPLTVAE
jgi:hypothetical protein